jgi:hypothetical protein
MTDKYRIFADMETDIALDYIKKYPKHQQYDIIRIMKALCIKKDTLKAIKIYYISNCKFEYWCPCGIHTCFKYQKRHSLSLHHIMYSTGHLRNSSSET